MKRFLATLEAYWWVFVAAIVIGLLSILMVPRFRKEEDGSEEPSFLEIAIEEAKDAKSKALVAKAKAKAKSDAQVERIEVAAREPDVEKRLTALSEVMSDL